MLNIASTLNGQDLGFLKIVANGWGIDIKAPDAYTARNKLIAEMINPETIKEIYDSFPENVHSAFDELLDNEGRIPWAKFTREYGEIQVMGYAKRDRERPDLHPVTPTEYLWYRAFIGRAFLSSENEPQEYAFIPEEIYSNLSPLYIQKRQIPGRLASSKEIQVISKSSDRILDESCTLLAVLRNEFDLDIYQNYFNIPTKFILDILEEMKLVSENGNLDPELIRIFLESTREESITRMVTTWLESNQINELSFLTTLFFDGNLDRNHKMARQFLIDQLFLVPNNQWWHIDSFITYIHQTNPDFQRPAGNYDTWFIKKSDSDEYLNGFNHWNEVDGAFLRLMITGPLYWLGLVDLGYISSDDNVTAFKLNEIGGDLLSRQQLQPCKSEEGKITIDSYGKIIFPDRFERAIRYQVSRFTDWDGKSNNSYIYSISPSSLNRAKEQGLKVVQFLRLMQSVLSHPFPPKLKTALELWDNSGTKAYFSNATLLHIDEPTIIDALQSSQVKKFILAVLNSNTVAVEPNAVEQVRKALLELGYLSEID